MDYWQIIWRNFKNGSNEAFEQIYNEFIDVLYRYGTKISANDDIVKDSIQQLFLELYSSRTKLSNPESIEFYLLKALKRIIIHRETKESIYIEYQDSVLPTFEIELDIENKIVFSEQEHSKFKLLNEILGSLSAENKELLYLKFYSGLNNQQIGAMIGAKSDTVRKQTIRILKKLQVSFIDRFLELFVLCFKA
ncbi:MAG: sigma-70 family RNA polymerase sigma factor [Mangrovibacterium sp.]|nr:sigma-70 family RNA polymerase sigma factor [Mangrovibacterium sp.]